MMQAAVGGAINTTRAGELGKIVSITQGRKMSGSEEQDRRDPGSLRQRVSKEGLKTLGNAAEYLAASRLILVERSDTNSNGEAIGVLRRLSRSVFQESLPRESSAGESLWGVIRRICQHSFDLRRAGDEGRWDW